MISNKAEIHAGAVLGDDVSVGPFTTIEGNVEIGAGTWIGSHVSIMSGVKIGKNCKIFPGAVIGAMPQDLKFNGEDSILEIGDNVTVREYCTLNRGTRANFKTRIGNNSLLMAYVHVAHDCVVGDHSVLANNVNLAGHVEIGNNAILGGLVAVHQFVKIGAYSMIGGGSLVRKDVPPYVKAAREPLSFVGINSIGLRRNGFTSQQINHIHEIYRILFVKGNNTRQALRIIEANIDATPEKEHILQFINDADRGIMKGFRQIN